MNQPERLSCNICPATHCVDVTIGGRYLRRMDVVPGRSTQEMWLKVPIKDCDIRQKAIQRAMETLEAAQQRRRKG